MVTLDSIRETVRKSGKTQIEIAASVGVSQRCVSKFLSGKGLSLASFQKFEKIFAAKTPRKTRVFDQV